MKQETGRTNLPHNPNKVSIRLMLDGHSFSITGLESAKPTPATCETVEVIAPRSMLVPRALYAKDAAAELMAANGMAPRVDETIVTNTTANQQLVALMAIPWEALDLLSDKLGNDIRFTTPLLTPLCATEPTMWIEHTAALLYIKVYDAKMQLAEVVPAETATDVEYFFETLNQLFPTKGYTLYIHGSNAKDLKRLLSKRFKKTICE